jgi:hypothetical protein
VGAKGEQIEAGLTELELEGWEMLDVDLPHIGGKRLVSAKRPLSPGELRRRESPAPT